MQAVRDNELAAGVVGVDTYGTKVDGLHPFGRSSAASAADCSPAALPISAPTSSASAESVVFLTMALLGGAAAPFGAALGTGLLILLPEWLRFLKVVYLAVYGAGGDPDHGLHAGRHLGLPGPAVAPAAPRAARSGAVAPLRPDRAGGAGGRLDPLFGATGWRSISAASRRSTASISRSARNTVHALIGPNGSGKTTCSTC